jgi:hypothetical protein
MAGHTLGEIGEILGTDYDSVRQMLSQLYGFEAAYIDDQERKTALATEVMRLDKLQTAFWSSAMMGDVGSGRMVLDCIKERSKLTGLEQADPVVNKNLVLVMGDKEEDYIAALKAATDD